MTAGELLERLRDAGVELWADGDRLRYDAPADALDEELLERLRRHKPEILALVRAPARDPAAPAPLGAAQEGFWLLDSLHPGHAGSNEQFAIFIDGPLDAARLLAAWRAVVGRHDVLRARFGASEGTPWQRFDAPVVEPAVADLEADAGGIGALAAREIARPFDLGRGGLLRPVLARLGPDRHALLVTAHHIVADGLSVAILRDELAALYADAGAALPPAPQYAERVARERRPHAAERVSADLAWWRGQLAGAPARHGLPRPVRAAGGPGEARRIPFAVPERLAARLRALARERGVTPYTVLLAALRVLLARLAGQDDVVIAAPVTLRDDAAARRAVGCLVNSVALRNPLGGNPRFEALLERERATLLAALGHRDAPFARVVEALGLPRDGAGQPLAQVLFQYDAAAPDVAAAGVTFRAGTVPADRQSWWDLEWSLTDRGAGGGFAGHLTYARAALEDGVAAALPGRWLALLEAAVAAPATPVMALPLLDPEERRRVLAQGEGPPLALPPGLTLHGAVARRWREAPEAVALLTAGGPVTAGALAARVESLAARLAALGVAPGDHVAISLAPSADLVAGIVAILAAGAAFVPLDPAYPVERLAFILRDSGARVLVTARAQADGAGFAGVARLEVDAEPAAGAPPPPAGGGFDAPAGAGPGVAPDAAACLLYTSGSTGEPKGAATLHRAALSRCLWMWREHGFGPDDVFCLRTSVNFVDSLWEIFGALLHGAPLAVLSAEEARDPALLVPALARHGVTHLVLVPPLLRALLERAPDLGARLPRLASLVTSGEPLPPDLWSAARRALPAARLLNTYGTSEIWDATCCDTTALAGEPARIPIGRPVANVTCRVLDAWGNPQPPGIPGELCVGGIGVGPGYWRRPELTAERYAPDPFAAAPGARLYRTGDLARWLPDGSLECLGRVDRQLKVRGFRVEPAEVEAVLRAVPGVRDAAVAARGEGGAGRLVAWVAGTAEEGELRAAAARRLPEFMQPAEWVLLGQLPQTPSGKVARDALPEPAARPARPARPPADAVEARLCELAAAVLGVPQVAPDDGFFDLGGQSLLAMRWLARVAAELGVALTLRDLFEAPTPAGLAARVRGRGAAAAEPALVPVPRDATTPLSWGQERLWFLDQLDPSSPAYNIAWTVTIDGPLDVAALAAALARLVARHESLRCAFPADGGRPRLAVLPPFAVPLAAERVAEGALEGRRRALARAPFDLARGPLLRAALLATGEAAHELVLVMHHAVTDGTSNGILFAELAACYDALVAGREPALPPLPVQYADFAAWQRRWLDGGRGSAQLEGWAERLAGAPAALELPTDFPRPAAQRFRGDWLWRAWPRERAARLRELARAGDATLYMLLLAAFKALLARASGQADLLVGTPVSSRPHAALEPLVGLFVNTVVMRTDCSGDPTFGELLARVRATAVEAFARQDAPFEQLVERLRPDRTLARAPVFQAMFNLVPMPERALAAGGARFGLGRLVDPGVSAFDLALTVGEHRDGLELVFEYDTDLFRRETVAALADALDALLDAALADPACRLSALPLVGPDGARRLRALGAGAGVAADGATVLSLFAAQVAARPGAPALVAGDATLTYAALDARAERIARALAARGCGRGDRVGLCLPRSTDLVAAALGALKAGAAYVPLDPDHPPARLAAMARDADLAALVTAGEARAAAAAAGPAPLLDLDAAAAELAAAPPGPLPAAAPAAGDAAYVVYTSGTTGEPKGVVVTHANLVAAFRGWARDYALACTDTHLQMASAAFDVFAGDWARALLSGGRLVLCPREALLDPPKLHALLARERVTVAEFVPAVVRPLLDWLRRGGAQAPRDLAFMRLVVVGSDTWHAAEYLALRAAAGEGARVVNSYGVAEATVDSSWFEGDAATVGVGTVPIGRPFPQANLRVLDARLRPVPPGLPGELAIGGAGVSPGYWRREALTAERFVVLADGERVYRTGDRARMRADGVVELLGRLDDQVKLRGFRIEPGEVEAALAAEPGVAACAAGLREAGPGDPRLVAWVVAAAGAAPDARAMRERLRGRLPDWMVPAAIEVVERLPLTPNGKVDRKALPAPRWGAGLGGGYAAARDAVEERLAELFAEVLGTGRVGIHDDFFALGGHSLLATRLASRVRDVLGVELALKALFESPTVAGLAARLPGAQARAAAVPRRAGPGARAPLSWPQQRLWFLEQLAPGNAAYHLHAAYRLRGPVDAGALQAALDALVARHESLRTRIVAVDGEPAQEIVAALAVPLEQAGPAADARGDGAGAGESWLQAELARRIEAPFDLARGPLLRAALLATGPAEHVLLLVVHHVVADGWSLAVLAGELSAAYGQRLRGGAIGLPALPVQYADYAQWQREALAGAELERQLAYWRARLDGAPPYLELPTDRPRPAVPGNRGAWHVHALPAALTPALTALARDGQATLFMVLLAGFQALLARWTGAEDLVVGTPIAGRPRSELEGLVGFFVNTLPLRGELAGDPPFAELVARVKRAALDAYAHADVPFEKLVEVLAPARSRAHAPLVQVLFVFHNEPRAPLALEGVAAEDLVVPSPYAKLDLSLHVAEHDGALVTSFAYCSELFDAETIAELAEGYAALLAAVAGPDGAALRLGELPALGERARARAAAEHARLRPSAVTVAAGGTLASRFAAQVAARGAAPAVRWRDGAWSYAELAARAGAVADALSAATSGATSGAAGGGAPAARDAATPVALLLGQDGPMVAGLLGAVLAGRPYVPLDPYAPAARHAAVLADAGAGAIVTDAARLAAAPWLREAGLPLVALEDAFAGAGAAVAGGPGAPHPPPAPETPAYLLYTSGTTGAPKGVVQTQGGALGQVLTWTGQLGITPEDRLTLISGYGYDAAVQDVFGALLTGASLHVLDLRGGEPAPELVARIARDGVTVLHATPTVYRHLFGDPAAGAHALSRVRLVVLGGEAARRSDLELFRARFRRPARLVNGLGLTECTTALQYFADHDTRVLGETLPVGLPVAGVRAEVRAEVRAGPGAAPAAGGAATDGPGGWQGELVLSGPYLAQGYHGDAALTAARFGPGDAGDGAGDAAGDRVAPPARRLRTGDRLRRLPDGQWLHAGRLDRQLKIRGVRVEPAEVEAALLALPGVRDARVEARPDAAGEATLVAWVAADAAPGEAALRRALRERLPEPLVPARIVALAALPRLPNGKVDGAALPAPGPGAATPGGPPRTPAERRLAALWRELLGRDGAGPGGGEIGAHDDFFALGGHSLAAARLVARLRDAFGVEVPLAALFEHTTLAGLAAHLEGLAGEGASAGADRGAMPAIRRLPRRPAGAGSEGDAP